MSTEKNGVGNLPANKTEQLATSEKFTNKVLKEFGSNVAGTLQITDYQRTLIQGYFIAIDRALQTAEDERIRKNNSNSDHKYDNDLPINWNTVNLQDLALDLVHYARMGLDMSQENMLFPIPYKNSKRNWYDVNLMEGYNGIRYIAERYAVEVPTAVTVEVVYSSDNFKPIKKGKNNCVESYEFEITNAFDRGTIIGGFAYLEFVEPTKNQLIIMSMKDIEKRKPTYASANFWGGKKKEKVGGKWEEVETEGWLYEMVRKTIIREAFSAKHLPRDPKKIDDNYQFMKMREAKYAEIEVQAEISANANVTPIDIVGGEFSTSQPPQNMPTNNSVSGAKSTANSMYINSETGEIATDDVAAPSAQLAQPSF